MSIKSDFLSIFPSSPEDMRMNLLTLSFEGKTEDDYRHHEIKKELGQRRIGLIIAVVIYALFGFIDMLIMPEVRHMAWFVRFGLFVPLGLVVFILSYVEKMQKWMDSLTTLVIIASGLGHLVILSYAPSEVRVHYYMGLVIFMLFSLTILRTDFIKSVLSGFVIFLGYLFYALQIEKASVVSLYSGVFILISCWMICSAACYLLEYKSRRNYYLNQIIHTGQLPKLPANEIVKEKTVVKTVESPVNKLFESLTDFVWFVSPTGEFKYISPAVKDFIGYEPEDLEGRRIHQIHASESHQLFEQEINRLGNSVNKLNLILEYKTRAGLIKQGSAVIIRYQDKRLGEGYLGSTRLLDEAGEIRPVVQDNEKTLDYCALESENASLRERLLEAQSARLDRDDTFDTQVETVVVDVKEVQINAVRQIFEGFRQDLYQEHLKLIEKTVIRTGQLEEKFATQSMKKYDLEAYLQESIHQSAMLEKKIQLQETIQTVFIDHMTHNHLELKPNAIHADKLIQKALIPLTPVFKGTQYVIDYDCPSHIAIETDVELMKSVIRAMVALSILYGFKNTSKGTIEIKAEVRDTSLVMHYLDDGNDYGVQAMDGAMNKLFDWDQRNPYVFNLIKELVEGQLKGTLGFDLSESRNAIRLVLPLSL